MSMELRGGIQLKGWLKYYWNGLAMVLGAVGYLGTAATGGSAYFAVLLLVFAYAATVGALVALAQLAYGLAHYYYCSKGNKLYLHHCIAGAVWLAGFTAWLIGAANGYYLTA